jgi:uncharacterized protein (DUF302 family)
MKRCVIVWLCVLWLAPLSAAGPQVRVWTVDKNLDTAYPVVYQALEANKFFVVFEPDIQNNLSRMAERWGDDYNRNKLSGIRAMVFCNGWYANQVSNADPDMLALCPLHITLVEERGSTRILFVSPSMVAQGSKAEALAGELEEAVAGAIAEALQQLSGSAAAP